MAIEAKTKEAQAEEYKKRAEADVNPNETPRQRLDRLTAEAKALEAQVLESERAEASAKVVPQVLALVKSVEAQNPGKVCRKLVVRYARPGDEEPEIVAKLEQGKPGIVMSFTVVKPKAKK